MKFTKLNILFFTFVFLFLFTAHSFSGADFDGSDTDSTVGTVMGFFDLRERETYIQITNLNPDQSGQNIHIQIFDVNNNCNENNFFDLYTPNDTHVYNLRDIQTNDGNESGVILPDNAYGIFVALSDSPFGRNIVGNQRILDNNGYEYRTNLGSRSPTIPIPTELEDIGTFNFNNNSGIILSEIIMISSNDSINSTDREIVIADILNVWTSYDVNIYDLNENVFSCRKVIASCVNSDSAQYEALLEVAANEQGNFCNGNCGASVADIEYGINDAIPHSKGGELLCPGNTIPEGIVRLERLGDGDDTDDNAVIYVGLNNGNGRGSMDSFFTQNAEIPVPDPT